MKKSTHERKFFNVTVDKPPYNGNNNCKIDMLEVKT